MLKKYCDDKFFNHHTVDGCDGLILCCKHHQQAVKQWPEKIDKFKVLADKYSNSRKGRSHLGVGKENIFQNFERKTRRSNIRKFGKQRFCQKCRSSCLNFAWHCQFFFLSLFLVLLTLCTVVNHGIIIGKVCLVALPWLELGFARSLSGMVQHKRCVSGSTEAQPKSTCADFCYGPAPKDNKSSVSFRYGRH